MIIRARRIALAQGVFGDRSRDDKLQQVIISACLAAETAQLEATEWLALYQRGGYAAIDVEISHLQFPFRLFNVIGIAGIKPAGQGKAGPVGDRDCLIKIPGAHDREYRPEDQISSWASLESGATSEKIAGPTKQP